MEFINHKNHSTVTKTTKKLDSCKIFHQEITISWIPTHQIPNAMRAVKTWRTSLYFAFIHFFPRDSNRVSMSEKIIINAHPIASHWNSGVSKYVGNIIALTAKNPMMRNNPWSVGTRGLAGTSGPGLSKIFHFLHISKPAIAITIYIAALPINGIIVSMGIYYWSQVVFQGKNNVANRI